MIMCYNFLWVCVHDVVNLYNLYTFGLKYVILSTLGLIELLKFFLRAGRTSIAEYV